MRYRTSAIIVLAIASSLHAQQPKSDPVVLTVAGRKITAVELCTAIGSLPPPQRTGYMQHPALARDWFGPLVALAEEAKREHLSVSSGQNTSEVDLDNALDGELIQTIAKSTQPSDAEIADYYSTHESDFEQAKARHIVISYATAFASRSGRSQAEAKAKADDIYSRLKQGADFGKLAAAESDDPYTKSKGGDLGNVSHRQLEPALDATIWRLAPGQISTPFEGRFGYEIVQVEDRETQSLDRVRENIIGRIRAEALERRQQEIVSAAHVTLAPEYKDAPLPCETTSKPFTLKDSLQSP